MPRQEVAVVGDFDSTTIISGYGLFGQESARKMHASLSCHGFGLSYDPSSKIFTVLKSANTTTEEIKQIFNENNYKGWAPQILEKVGSNGNHLVELTPVVSRLNREQDCRRLDSCSKQKTRLTNPYREEILHSSEYGDLMKDSDVLFHGINAAVWKIPSILELGILSWQVASSRGLSLAFNYGADTQRGIVNGYNGKNFISCARSPVHIDALGDKYGAFSIYIKEGISFAVRGVSAIGVYSLGEHDSGMPGEAMVADAIPSKSIIGLVVPVSLLRTKVADINFLQGGAMGTFHLRCQSLLKYLEDNKIDVAPSLITAVAKPVNDDDGERLEPLFNRLLLQCFSSKIDTESACLLDLLKILIPRELSIYDTNGFKIA